MYPNRWPRNSVARPPPVYQKDIGKNGPNYLCHGLLPAKSGDLAGKSDQVRLTMGCEIFSYQGFRFGKGLVAPLFQSPLLGLFVLDTVCIQVNNCGVDSVVVAEIRCKQ